MSYRPYACRECWDEREVIDQEQTKICGFPVRVLCHCAKGWSRVVASERLLRAAAEALFTLTQPTKEQIK